MQALGSVASALQSIAPMSFIMNRTVSTPRAVQRPCSGVRSSVARAVAPRPQRRAAQFITRATEVIVSGLRAAAATARCGARSSCLAFGCLLGAVQEAVETADAEAR